MWSGWRVSREREVEEEEEEEGRGEERRDVVGVEGE